MVIAPPVLGGAGIDTLNIIPIGVAAITPTDSYWSHISNIEKIVIDTTGAGAQTITTGAAFQAAFAAAGVDLTTTSNGGAITIDMNTFTGAATLTTSSDAGAQTITTGPGVATVAATSTDGALTIPGENLVTVAATSGAGAQTITGANLLEVSATSGAGAQTITTGLGHATVTATSGAGAQTITGANLLEVSATSTGAGAQTITSTGASDVTVTATSDSGATTIVTGAGNDTITVIASAAAGANTITAGAGADTITLVTNGFAAPHTIVIGNTDSGIDVATADRIIGFNAANDSLKMGTAGIAGNYVAADAGVADFTAAHTAADAALTGAERYSFQWDATNGYLFNDVNGDGTADHVVVLVGLTGATFAAGDVIV